MRPIRQTFAMILIGYPGVTAWMPPNRPVEFPPEPGLSDLVSSSVSQLEPEYHPEDWAPKGVADEMKVQYFNLEREFEGRELYRVVDPNEIIQQTRYRRNFARYALLRLGAIKADKELRKFDKRYGGAGARAARTYRRVLGRVGAPVALAAQSQQLSYGTSLAFLELEAKGWLRSSLVNGEILYRPERSWLPTALKTRLDLLEPEERWLLSLFRPNLPGETEGKLSYGSTSSRVRLSLRKSFLRRLGSEYQVSAQLPGYASPEHVVSLQYSIQI